MTPTATVLAQQSAPVTAWPARIALTGAVLAALAVLATLMRRGWRRRAARHAGLPPLPPVPPGSEAPDAAVLAGIPGGYTATTTAGDWLDRVVVHGLGARSLATLTVTPAGVLLARTGAPDVFIPADAVAGVRLDRGLAGTVTERDGLVVVTWRHGDALLDTAFRPRHAADRDRVRSAVESLLQEVRP